MAERPTFSPFWHRVRSLKARLRPHVQITRQHYRGKRWHVVHDPASNQYFRLSPVAHEFVALLDGARTIEDVWKLSLSRHGDDAPTQNEVIQLLSQLHQGNLLSADVPAETEQLLARGRERVKKKVQQQAIGIMYFRIKLFNPDRILSWIEPILRPVLNRWGLIAWAIFCVAALVQLAPHWDRLVGGFDSAIAPSNWGWLIVVFIVTKAIHETGHGVICKSLGRSETGDGAGQVPEFGIMLLVLFPAPYVDASAAWAFASKWKRIAVGAGGMLFELFVASIAALVWLNSAPGLVNQIAYNAIFTASVSTILFNANPLMRFDGYYILSDFLEVPNLMQRSMNQLKYYFQRYVYRVENPIPPTTQPGERAILTVYGILATAYRIFLFFSITLYVMGKMFAIGLVLAIWTAGMWFVMPVGKFVHWLASNNQLAEFRPRAWATTLAMVALVLVGVGAIPWPDHRSAAGVVESAQRTGVFAAGDGFVVEALVRPGDRVREGDPILVKESPELESRLAQARAQLAGIETLTRDAVERNPAAASIAREREAALRRQLAHYTRERDRLTVRAPHDGTVVSADPSRLVGSYVQRGSPICEIVAADDVRVAAVLSQLEAAWHFELGPEQYDVQMRPLRAPGNVYRGDGVTVIEAGQTELPHAGLGYAGGGTIETRPDDQSGLVAKEAQFVMRIASFSSVGERSAWSGLPGERVRLRFTLPAKPLLFQWIDRLHKLVQGRVNL